MTDEKIIEAVREEAIRYWQDVPVEILLIWIDERQRYGRDEDIIVKVRWTSEETKDSLRDDMIYTVTNDDDDIYVDGPEW